MYYVRADAFERDEQEIGIFTVSTKTARVGYEVISRRRSLPIFLIINGKWSMVNGQFKCVSPV